MLLLGLQSPEKVNFLTLRRILWQLRCVRLCDGRKIKKTTSIGMPMRALFSLEICVVIVVFFPYLSVCIHLLCISFSGWLLGLDLVFHCLLYLIQVLLCLCSLANVYDLHSLDGG